MTDQQDDTAANEKKLVLWGYILQWASLVMPFAILASPIYVLVVRGRVTHPWLRTHFVWQLATCGLIGMAAVVGALFFVIGLSGVSTDNPISIVATFLAVGLSVVFPFWFIYRCLRGTMNYSGERPMGNPWL